jgi:hypothetical protein
MRQGRPKLGLLLQQGAGPRVQAYLPSARRTPAALTPGALEAQVVARPPQVSVAGVHVRPGTFELPDPPAALKSAAVGRCVGIHHLDAPMLEKLDSGQFERLLGALSGSQHHGYWSLHTKQMLVRLHLLPWLRGKSLSGTSVLVLSLMARGQHDMAERVVRRRPIELALELADSMPELFGVQTLSAVFGDLVPTVTQQKGAACLPQDTVISAMGAMVAAFMALHACGTAEGIETCTLALMQRLEDAGFAPTSSNLGLLAGVIFSGGLRYNAALRTQDMARLTWITNFTLLAFAATNFSHNSNLVGGLALAAVVVGIALSSGWPVRDHTVSINGLHGKLGARLANLDIFKSVYDRDMLMDWIGIARQCNGF